MTKIKPFKALIYNQEKIKDLSRVVCPPYDVISPQKQQVFHDLHPQNFVHIILGKDVPSEDKYLRAGNYFKEWQKEKVFTQDAAPAVYFYSQQYNLKGETKTRLGFISLLYLEDKNSAVFGHEHTRMEAKTDRFKLMKQVKANLDPIFVIFADKKRIIQRIYKDIQNQDPFINVTDDEKTVHKVWRIDSPDMLKIIESSMRPENMFIADGHHRYEVACAYRQEIKEKLGSAFTGEENFNYVLSYFTNTDFRGLTILPIHRLLKLNTPVENKGFCASLAEYFDVEEVKDKTQFFFLMQKGGRAEHVLGMYKDKKFWLLRLKNVRILDKMMADKPKEYRSLDVSILNTIILKKILGVDIENKDQLIFHPDAEQFIAEVDNHPGHIAFFLNPVKIQQIISVALCGNKMPAKSTYFYPKVLSGLVINKLEG